ncbi:MAG: hypothetical protein IJK05_02650 [Bacteroidales bacterium]|nr:hypothetical protein [Bacteroidales bacterium]
MKKTLIPVLAALLFGASLGAQTLQTAYFSDDFTYSYRLNPAFHPNYSFVGLPVVGAVSGSYKGDFSLRDIFYKSGGETVTFMNESVAASDFLGNFKKGLNKFSTESYTNLLGIGFKAGGLYNIVDVNVRNYSSGKIPYDLARFLKEGMSGDGSFDLSGLNARSTSFFELGITSSWKANRKLTVGMRFKGVIGFVNSYIDMDRMTISHSGDNWSVSSAGVIAAAYDGLSIAGVPSTQDPSVEMMDLRHTKVGKPKGLMNGYGVGADVGILYDDSSWQISASVSDIGCVFWFHNLYGHASSGSNSYSASYESRSHGAKAIDNEFNLIGAMLGDALDFVKEDEYQSLESLPLTVRLGARYLYLSDLSFGGLATFRYDAICPFWEARGSVNYRPVKQVELVGSLGLGTLGVCAGLFANAHLGFVNVFAGTDNLIGTSGSAFIPSTKGAPNFVAGLNFAW